jgi:hypothetical protein
MTSESVDSQRPFLRSVGRTAVLNLTATGLSAITGVVITRSSAVTAAGLARIMCRVAGGNRTPRLPQIPA